MKKELKQKLNQNKDGSDQGSGISSFGSRSSLKIEEEVLDWRIPEQKQPEQDKI